KAYKFRIYPTNDQKTISASYKSRKNRQLYSTNNQKGSIKIEDGKIKLPKVS
ncbi:MAG: helix-turn-helix domain-containing protein, partial [Selenomonadaceae bacterium]|nr:helix-turn-helix domain-containing protein [Selenomonadaceae bacterium]